MFDPASITLPKTGPKSNPHPLVWGLDKIAHLGFPAITIARALDITPQMLYIWRRKASENRNFLLPAEQVPTLSRLTGVAPHYFRPDLWKRDWTF